jgi:hypothetical protein
MKLTKSQLTQMIKEELEVLTEASAAIRALFNPMEEMYDSAPTPEAKEQLENNIIMVFKNIIKSWREGRESPDAWKSGY